MGGVLQVANDLAGQPANIPVAADINVDQAEAFHPGAARGRVLAQIAEQAHALAAAGVVDVKVGNGVAVALKDGRVGRNAGIGLWGVPMVGVVKLALADGQPALAAIPVSVVGAVASRAGVKVQVGAQFVALAAGGRAAHPGGRRIGEGAAVPAVGGSDGG